MTEILSEEKEEELRKICAKIREYFEKDINYKRFLKLSSEYKKVVLKMMIDLLPDKKTNHCDMFLQKLLDEKEKTYNDLGKYFAEYYQSQGEEIEIADINSRLEKILKSKTLTDKNAIKELLCDFFSVSLDVLNKGKGDKYELNLEELLKEIKMTKGGFEKFMDLHEENIKNDIEECVFTNDGNNYRACIQESHKLFHQYLSNTQGIKTPLHKETIELFDDTIFPIYQDDLDISQRNAIGNLIDNLLML